VDWIKIKININPQNLETLSPALFALGAEGVEEKNDTVVIYFSRKNWSKEIKDKISSIVTHEFSSKEKIDIEIDEIPTEAWNEKWKENFKPFNIGGNLMIYPDWEALPSDSDTDIIVISPKMAFGTGHHETTRLILETMPKYLKKGMTILDAGTGSGILAIYGIMMGADHVVAYDFDEVATENTIENIQLNHVSDKIAVITGELKDTPPQKYDMILANINKNVLIDISESLPQYARKQAILILSGLLREDFEQMVSLYEKNWQLIEHNAENEWITLVFRFKS
jgi:ribosomal protein L11 methyltransferase